MSATERSDDPSIDPCIDPCIDPWTERQRKRWLRPDAARYWRPDAARWLKPALSYAIEPAVARKYNFDPAQPRDDHGRWVDVGDAFANERSDINGRRSEMPADRPRQVAGGMIWICVAGSRSLTTDRWGNKSFWVRYDCSGGLFFELRGAGHHIRSIVRGPFR
jgi:hypothetical protein